MIIKNEGIIFSEELYMNYLYQFNEGVANQYKKRTISIREFVQLSVQQVLFNESLKQATKILQKLRLLK